MLNISRWPRHSSTKITEKYDLHFDVKSQIELAIKMGEILAPSACRGCQGSISWRRIIRSIKKSLNLISQIQRLRRAGKALNRDTLQMTWRRVWDLNPGNLTVCRFSRAVPSTTRPTLHIKLLFTVPENAVETDAKLTPPQLHLPEKYPRPLSLGTYRSLRNSRSFCFQDQCHQPARPTCQKIAVLHKNSGLYYSKSVALCQILLSAKIDLNEQGIGDGKMIGSC